MATAISIAEVPRPSDVEAEVLNAFDARQKLQTTIETENLKRDTAETEFARTVAKEISSSKVVNVEAVFQRSETGKAAADRAKQRLDALASILAKVNKRIDQLKADCSDTVNKALTKRIEALEKILSDKNNAGKGIEEEIKVLKAELSKLSKAAPRKGTD